MAVKQNRELGVRSPDLNGATGLNLFGFMRLESTTPTVNTVPLTELLGRPPEML